MFSIILLYYSFIPKQLNNIFVGEFIEDIIEDFQYMGTADAGL